VERQYDLVITGGTIYTPEGPVVGGQICVSGEKIAAINSRPDTSIAAAKEIDASGLLVLPGAIDTHSHHRDPGFTYKEDITSATGAAALGGVTTSIGMPNVDPPTVTPERYAALIESQQQRAIVDFNHNPAPTMTEHVLELAQMGALGLRSIWSWTRNALTRTCPGWASMITLTSIEFSRRSPTPAVFSWCIQTIRRCCMCWRKGLGLAATSASETTPTPRPGKAVWCGTWPWQSCLSFSGRRRRHCTSCT
jgi:hypothetical protein